MTTPAPMNTSDALATLRQSPLLPQVVQELQALLEDEYQRRQAFYDTLDPSVKAEWINGEAVVHSPVRLLHNDVSLRLALLIRAYLNNHPLGVVHHEKVMIRLTRNSYEPDVCFFGAATAASFTPDMTLLPAPDFIAEVLSEATAARDRGVKFTDYAAHGVGEYWIIDADEELVEQYTLHAGHYQLQQRVSAGEIRSATIAGFRIPVRALFDTASERATLLAIMAGEITPAG